MGFALDKRAGVVYYNDRGLRDKRLADEQFLNVLMH